MLPFDLKKICRWLANEGFDCDVIKEDLVTHEDQIMLNAGNDDHGRNLFFYLKFLEGQEKPENEEEKRYLLQFFLPFPIKIEEGSQSELARYLMMMNKTIEFPCLGMCEFNKIVFFRYVYLCAAKGVNTEAILTNLAMALLVWDLFGDNIEELASNHKKFSQILKEAADTNLDDI
jgi:hypothetical protein